MFQNFFLPFSVIYYALYKHVPIIEHLQVFNSQQNNISPLFFCSYFIIWAIIGFLALFQSLVTFFILVQLPLLVLIFIIIQQYRCKASTKHNYILYLLHFHTFLLYWNFWFDFFGPFFDIFDCLLFVFNPFSFSKTYPRGGEML